MPCKNFFLLSLAPTHSFTSYPLYPLPLSIRMTGMLLNCNPDSTSSTTLNCELGFPLQVLQTTGTLLSYYLESCDMPSGHVHSTPGTCDMPSGHMLPPSLLHEMYNMPSGCTVSPGTSGCTTLTCTIPLTIPFPSCLPYRKETYTRHLLSLEEEEHMQDSHIYIMDLEDPCDYPPSALHNIHEATPTDNPSCLLYQKEAHTQDNSAASLPSIREAYIRQIPQ